LAKLPATRQTNRSPLPLSKAYSARCASRRNSGCRRRDSVRQPALPVHA
jgi:hypothetical protein